jgi:hypothetical protein
MLLSDRAQREQDQPPLAKWSVDCNEGVFMAANGCGESTFFGHKFISVMLLKPFLASNYNSVANVVKRPHPAVYFLSFAEKRRYTL